MHESLAVVADSFVWQSKSSIQVNTDITRKDPWRSSTTMMLMLMIMALLILLLIFRAAARMRMVG